MNIYLDVSNTLIFNGQAAAHAEKFLKYMTDRHTCFWLSSLCPSGSGEPCSRYVATKLSEAVRPLLDKIRPTNWYDRKTEAIDFSEDFLWFDDYLGVEDQIILSSYNAMDKFVLMKLRENPEQLKEYISS